MLTNSGQLNEETELVRSDEVTNAVFKYESL